MKYVAILLYAREDKELVGIYETSVIEQALEHAAQVDRFARENGLSLRRGEYAIKAAVIMSLNTYARNIAALTSNGSDEGEVEVMDKISREVRINMDDHPFTEIDAFRFIREEGVKIAFFSDGGAHIRFFVTEKHSDEEYRNSFYLATGRWEKDT